MIEINVYLVFMVEQLDITCKVSFRLKKNKGKLKKSVNLALIVCSLDES